MVLFWLGGRGAKSSAVLDYSTFMQRVEAGEVDKITIDPDGPVVGTQTDGTAFTSQIPTAVRPEDLVLNLGEHGVTIAAKAELLEVVDYLRRPER